jgi:hypothetical protein
LGGDNFKKQHLEINNSKKYFMRNKKSIICISILFLVLIGGILYSVTSKTTTSQGDDFFDTVQPSVSCAKEGEEIGTCVGCMTQCCDGLKGMADLKNNNECIRFAAPGSTAMCSKCGNSTCDTQNNEDECNCPEDCK